MTILGIDPGSARTGFGCIESDGTRYRHVECGAISAPARASFPERLRIVHARLSELLTRLRPDVVAIEDVFYAANARSALRLGHVRGVAVLAAAQAGLTVAEYSPLAIKRAVVGYGRAEKQQVQQMVRVLLGLAEPPKPHDAADALAVAICHGSHAGFMGRVGGSAPGRAPRGRRVYARSAGRKP